MNDFVNTNLAQAANRQKRNYEKGKTSSLNLQNVWLLNYMNSQIHKIAKFCMH